MKKVFVFGIDGAFPEYIFGEWLEELPNIKRILESGCYAKLNSTVPPLSATAWTSIATGKTPSDTGIFEYTYRRNYSYTDTGIITSKNVKEKTVWEIVGNNNKKAIIYNVILTWPVKPFNGLIISGPLTPADAKIGLTHPNELKQEIINLLGEFPGTDVPNFRNINPETTISEVIKLTEKNIKIMKYLIQNKEWGFFWGIIGMSDRMNHAFWRYADKLHRRYDPQSEFRNALKDYYKFVDAKLGELLLLLDEDTCVIILSDHGITRMHTRVNLTDWLIKGGYMKLKETLNEKKEFTMDMVDWSKTKVFTIGAYEGQIFLNLKGREPEGIVEPKDYDKLINELELKLKKIIGDRNEKLDTKIFKKKEYFNEGKCKDIAPDMIVYFDNLQYGCNTTLIGNETLWSLNTAKGSDDAGHSRQGIFIMKDGENHGNLGEISYLDIAPTILNLLDIKIPEDMNGKAIGN